MKAFYEAIASVNPNAESRTVTLLDESGEQAVLSAGEVVFLSHPAGFLALHQKEIEAIKESGILTLDGKEIYAEILGNARKVVICGGGHVSMPIIRISKMIGCHVTVLEDRPQFAENAEKAGADQVILAPFEEGLQQVTGDRDTFFIIVTRGHQFDSVCLRQIAQKRHAYIGMMGSARRVRIVMQRLAEEGIDKTVLDAVHSPIGLNIHAETPEEIAVSILAELIAVKNQEKHFTYPDDMMAAILGGRHTEPLPGRKIMASIISRKGSAPRGVGARMLFLEDGSTIGTIGGGCTEGDVITKVREMFASGSIVPTRMTALLQADEAALEGEVCGGLVEIFLTEA